MKDERDRNFEPRASHENASKANLHGLEYTFIMSESAIGHKVSTSLRKATWPTHSPKAYSLSAPDLLSVKTFHANTIFLQVLKGEAEP